MNISISIQRALIILCVIGFATHANGQSNSGRFELLHLWAQPEEQKALAAFSQPMRNAGLDWKEQHVRTNFKGIRENFSKRVAMEVAPTGTFWIGGNNLKKLVKGGSFRLIPNEVDQRKFSDVLVEPVYDILKYRDGISAVPLGIHVQNHAIYNKKILEEIGRDVPKNWKEFLEIAPLIQLAGYDPISISSEPWQLQPLILSLISESFTKEDVAYLFNTEMKLEFMKPRMTKVFTVLSQLRHFVNEDYENLSWQESVDKVKNKQAFANFLGDYTSPLIEDHPDVICATPPGNKFVLWSFDVVALTNNVESNEIKGQDLFLSTVMNSENNEAYISHKGGIPVFKTNNHDSFNRCTKFMLKRWDSTPDRFNISASNWSKQLNVITTIAKEFFRDHSQKPEDAAYEITKSIFALNLDR